MAAPAVRDLNKLIAQIGQSVKPQQALIESDIAANDKAGAAQIEGLGAQKDQAFNDITQAAQDKNMFFSGFSPSEQAKYTAGTYLPALAQLQATIASTRSQLLGKKADLQKGVFDTAFATREGDIAAKRDWTKMTADQKFRANQAAADRAFKAAQGSLNRAATAKANAPNIDSNIRAMLNAASGKDGKVSPTDWAHIVGYAYANGIKFGGKNGFANTYWDYANGSHWKDYKNGFEKYLK